MNILQRMEKRMGIGRAPKVKKPVPVKVSVPHEQAFKSAQDFLDTAARMVHEASPATLAAAKRQLAIAQRQFDAVFTANRQVQK